MDQFPYVLHFDARSQRLLAQMRHPWAKPIGETEILSAFSRKCQRKCESVQRGLAIPFFQCDARFAGPEGDTLPNRQTLSRDLAHLLYAVACGIELAEGNQRGYQAQSEIDRVHDRAGLIEVVDRLEHES